MMNNIILRKCADGDMVGIYIGGFLRDTVASKDVMDKVGKFIDWNIYDIDVTLMLYC